MTAPENPVFVLADHYRMAVEYARANDLGPEGRGWVFTTRLRQVLGRTGPGRFVWVSIGAAPRDLAEEQRVIATHLRLYGFTEADR
jgi:hypothetical protein